MCIQRLPRDCPGTGGLTSGRANSARPFFIRFRFSLFVYDPPEAIRERQTSAVGRVDGLRRVGRGICPLACHSGRAGAAGRLAWCRRLPARNPADSVGQLLSVPWSRRVGPQGRPSTGSSRRRVRREAERCSARAWKARAKPPLQKDYAKRIPPGGCHPFRPIKR